MRIASTAPTVGGSSAAVTASEAAAMAPKHRTAAVRVIDFFNVSTARVPKAGRAALAAHTRAVSDRAGLIDARIPIDVSGRAGLVDPGVSTRTRPAQASGGTRLIDSGVAAWPRPADIPGGARLIEARVAIGTDRAGVTGCARLIDATVARMQDRGNADRYDREAHCHGCALDGSHGCPPE
jgi:hypothetical protein